MTTTEHEVLEVAADLVAAFGREDLPAYFSFFADDATFVFHTTAPVLDSVDAYRREWAEWERENGFRVLSCTSSEQRVQDLGGVVVFSHRVATRIATNAGEEDTRERETIVFQRQDDGRWLAVHEHLSVDPTGG